jgi:hypothetical protein
MRSIGMVVGKRGDNAEKRKRGFQHRVRGGATENIEKNEERNSFALGL